jgi:regulator of RNase E activity RraA
MPVTAATLAAFRSVRTSDVTDALDSMGLQERYEMDPAMVPMFPGIRFAGLAHTFEYRRIDKPLQPMSYEEFDERQYKRNPDGSTAPDALWKGPGGGAPDEVIVIDAKRTRAGILGSHNTMECQIKGTVGFVIDGVCRDSTECMIQKTPVFCTVRSPAHPMGRIVNTSENAPIVCAGVVVRPGDVVIGDDDGVVVVPAEIAEEVARRAILVQAKDRPNRRSCYERLGRAFDETVTLE